MTDFKGDVMGIRLDEKARRLYVIERTNVMDEQNHEWDLRPNCSPSAYPKSEDEIEAYVATSRSNHSPITSAWSNLKMHNPGGYEQLKSIVTK